MIKSPTWIIHAVFADEDEINNVGTYFGNIHTHGLGTYNHSELCIPIWIAKELSGTLLNQMGMNIANNNRTYDPGIIVGELQGGYDLKGIRFANDPTLYVLLPDPNNKFYDDSDCDPEYAKQYDYAKHISETKGYV